MDLKFNGKTALITGGSKGIGAAIATTLAEEGTQVAIVNRAGPEGPALVKTIESRGGKALFLAADLCHLENCHSVVEETLSAFGGLDIVINNAGVNDGVGIDAGPEEFLASIQRNLTHVYAVTHHSIAALRKSRGVIINIGSKVSVTGQGKTSGYAAAKGGILGLTREWAVDFAEHGIRVNAVLPAETWTPLYDKWLKTLPDPSAMKGQIEKMIPFEHRFTTTQELADMVVFLASPRSSHTTGQIIFVDGGYTHFDRKYTSSESCQTD